MNWKPVHLLMAFLWLPVVARPDEPASAASRDGAGFLVAPAAPSEPALSASSASVAAAAEPSTNTAVTASASGDAVGNYVLDDKHKLMPGDRVSFQILEDRTNAIPLTVAESTELDIPYIGRMSVKDRTCKQLAEEVKRALEKDYYHRATVIIGLDSLSRILGRVYIFGPVRNPGAVEIPANGNFTAGKAIIKAGGFGDFANPKKVQIIRETSEGRKVFEVNMINVLKKGMTGEDVTLEPEDFIIVPESKINFGW